MRRATRRALGFGAGLVARVLLSTLRLSLLTHPKLEAVQDKPWVLAFWHGQQFALHRWPRRRRLAVMVSLSDDGELQASALRRLRYVIVRGSSSRSGANGLKGIVRRMREGSDSAFAVDGPRGPRGVVRDDGDRVGAILAARIAGGVVVPFASACSSAWVFARAWDRFELPRPFSRVAVALGPPLDPRTTTGPVLARHIDEARSAAVRAAAGNQPPDAPVG
jgi:lysophospholipid acyltransferase (LPLAT)-like uncharacterized protein